MLVPKGKEYAHITSADYFWNQRSVKVGLICPSPTEVVGRNFLEGLNRRGVRWPVTIEAGSAAVVTKYVGDGHGVGVSLGIPELVKHPRVRVVLLDGFPPVTIGVMWRKSVGRPEVVLEIVSWIANQFWRELVVTMAPRFDRKVG